MCEHIPVADTLENRILPAIARHIAEIKQQQAAAQAKPKQGARVRGTATFTSSNGQSRGTRGIPPSTAGAPSTTGRCSWGVPPARKPTLASGAAAASGTRKAGTQGRATAQKSIPPSDLLKTRCAWDLHLKAECMHSLCTL